MLSAAEKKERRKKFDHEHYLRYRERYLEHQKEYYNDNIEKFRAYGRAYWRKKSIERIKEEWLTKKGEI